MSRKRSVDVAYIVHGWVVYCAFLVLPGWSPIRAEDRVVVIDRSGREVIRTGEVLHYSTRELAMRLPQGTEVRVEADRVLRVETPRSPQHKEADKLFQSRQYGPALATYRQALESESRLWIKRVLYAQTIRCLRNEGQVNSAATAFLVLIEEEPQSRQVDAIPLAWTATAEDVSLDAKFRTWLEDRSQPWARLIAASWLLPGARRFDAKSTLEQLARNEQAPISELARVQLWRTQVADVSPFQLERWKDQTERLPESLRAGPYFVLGQALGQRDSSEAALLAFLRVPLLYSEQHHLAAEALGEAARLLEADGNASAALRLRRELIRDYSNTVAGRHAEQQMQ
jgi:tetratricopeptide (TPR) repeat protein